MPRKPILVKEGEQTVSVALKPFLVFDRSFRCVSSVNNMFLIEAFDYRAEFLEMSAL